MKSRTGIPSGPQREFRHDEVEISERRAAVVAPLLRECVTELQPRDAAVTRRSA